MSQQDLMVIGTQTVEDTNRTALKIVLNDLRILVLLTVEPTAQLHRTKNVSVINQFGG